MLDTVLALLPKVTAALAAAPEFVALIDRLKDQLGEDDQAVLQSALELAQDGSDAANADLAALVAARVA